MGTKIRYMIRTVICIFLLVLVMSVSAAFKGSGNTPAEIAVMSYDYPGLTSMRPADFDAEEYRLSSFTDDPYYKYQCCVNIKDGVLLISNDATDSPASYFSASGGYFIGVDRGEFGGWVDHFADDAKEDARVRVSENNCRGFIETGDGSGRAFILTADYESWQVLLVSPVAGGCDVEWHEMSRGDGYAHCGVYDKSAGVLYVVTAQGIAEVSGDGAVRMVHEFPTCNMVVNSAVLLEGELYCGTGAGVYRFRIAEGDGIWYPMNYSKYVG